MAISEANIISLICSFVIIGGYHVFLLVMGYFFHSERLESVRMNKYVKHWVSRFIAEKDSITNNLMIHTLRNITYAVVFLTGYTMKTAYSLYNEIVGSTNRSEGADIRDGIVVSCLFLSTLSFFQCFVNVLPLSMFLFSWATPSITNEPNFEDVVTTHSSSLPSHKVSIWQFMSYPSKSNLGKKEIVPVTESPNDVRLDDWSAYKQALRMCENLTFYFSYGFRFLIISIPFSFYVLGPAVLIITSVIMVIIECIWDFGLPSSIANRFDIQHHHDE